MGGTAEVLEYFRMIILADDEQQILYGMKKGIEWEKLGFRVAGVAQNGKEALELMEEVHPDLVISDIKMPFMDGLELGIPYQLEGIDPPSQERVENANRILETAKYHA